jgi:CheY-like chemotaxis protein
MTMQTLSPILLVEDHEDDVELLQCVLKSAGVLNPIVVVTDGEEAIAYLQGAGDFADRAQFPLPGVLMLDLKMPRLGGFEVLGWLKNESEIKDLLVVVLSGYRQTWEVDRAYLLGAHAFLLKPCSVDDIRKLSRDFPPYWTVAPRTPVRLVDDFEPGARETQRMIR